MANNIIYHTAAGGIYAHILCDFPSFLCSLFMGDIEYFCGFYSPSLQKKFFYYYLLKWIMEALAGRVYAVALWL